MIREAGVFHTQFDLHELLLLASYGGAAVVPIARCHPVVRRVHVLVLIHLDARFRAHSRRGREESGAALQGGMEGNLLT
jgi:hypothetical protein